MDLEPVPALELGGELPGEGSIRVEPRHLVLVLVGHELEEVAGDRLGELAPPRHPPLGVADPRHRLPVARRIGFVLVGRQEGGPVLDQLVQRPGPWPLGLAGPDHRLDGGRVVRRPPAPDERLPVQRRPRRR